MSQPGFHHALEIGYQLHWYTIGQVLGQGGFGITYQAHDNNLDQRVAIKEFLPIEYAVRGEDDFINPVTKDKDDVYRWALDRFLTEARTLAKFDHPNIVRVLAVFEANNAAYIVMHYETGETLEHYFEKHGILSESELLNILLPIIDGLELVHKEGFIHRDIKPANIIIREDNSPVLIDFGAARQAIGEKTHTLTALVSTGFSAIEQYYSKAEDQGAWTDIYGLASTFYYGLTGNRPADAMTRSKAILASKPDAYISAMHACQGRYSTAFLNAIDQGMQFMPEDRPQDVGTWKKYFIHTDIPDEQIKQLIKKSQSTTTETTHPPKLTNQDQPMPRIRLTGWIGGVLILVITLVAGILLYNQGSDQQTAKNDSTQSASSQNQSIPSILVLPFQHIGKHDEDDYFIDGMTVDIITDLSKLSNLLVIAQQTALSFKGRDISPKDAGRELGVGYILDGSMRRAGDSLRVNAQLIDVNSEYPLWAERYDRKLDNIFDIQDDIAGHIVKELSIRLTTQEQAILKKTAQVDFQAYDLFLRGQDHTNRRTREDIAEAIRYNREAIDLDPSFARAYGSMAINIVRQFREGWSEFPHEAMDRALNLALKAVSIDASVPQVHWALGFVHLYRKEYQKAIDAVKKSIEISPNYADGYGLLGLISNNQGKPEEAITYIKKGMRMNPYYSFDYPYNLGRANYLLGQYEQAVTNLKQALVRNEFATHPRLYLAASYVKMGLIEDAEWEIEQLLLNSTSLSTTLLRAGLPQQDEILEELLDDLRAAGLPE